MSKKKIILTGGGSAGHVTPNIALVPFLKKEGYEIVYIGSKNGIEKDLITKEGIKYYGISSGKLRRYFHLKNFTDPFRVLKGLLDCMSILRKEKPDIIFSKGGFVAVPVIIAGRMQNVPSIAHESDMTPGLANKISMPYASKVCVTFDAALKYIKNNKGVLTGTPIREDILKGDKGKGLKFLNFKEDKEILLIMGGSLGSKFINDSIRGLLKNLLKNYNIVHLCGKNNLDESLNDIEGYRQFQYLSEELPDIISSSDYIISRAGANSIFEFLTLSKPNILIPLSKAQSRGDQILNARHFVKKGYSLMIEEEELTEEKLLTLIKELKVKKDTFIENMNKSTEKNGTDNIISLIKKYS